MRSPTIVARLLILQRAGDDLAGAGGVLVDQHDQRERDVVVAGVRFALAAVGWSRVSRSARVLTIVPSRQELVGDSVAAREQAAGVVAQVEDDRLARRWP